MDSKRIISTFAQQQVDEMVFYLKEKYCQPDFSVETKFSFSKILKKNTGGRKKDLPFIKLSLNSFIYYLENDVPKDEWEYPHYADSPIIGQLNNVHWTKALSSLIAHELSHTIQLNRSISEIAAKKLGFGTYDVRDQVFLKHNSFFQEIYADLRKKFVNPFEKFPFKTFKVIPYRKYKKTWYSREKTIKGGGKYFTYFNQDDSIIGILYKKRKTIWLYDSHIKEYTQTNFNSICQARKSIFGI